MGTKRFLELVGSNICTEALREVELADGGLTCSASGYSATPPSSEPRFLSLSYTAVITRAASTHENIRKIIVDSSTKNKARGITGIIKFGNLFDESESPNLCVEQVLEGSIYEVLLLWQKIKSDPRVEKIESTSHVISVDRSMNYWHVNMDCFATGAFARAFKANHIKLR